MASTFFENLMPHYYDGNHWQSMLRFCKIDKDQKKMSYTCTDIEHKEIGESKLWGEKIGEKADAEISKIKLVCTPLGDIDNETVLKLAKKEGREEVDAVHCFIIFKTKTFLWSLEKLGDCLLLQRGSDVETKRYYPDFDEETAARKIPQEKLSEGPNNSTMGKLFDILYDGGELKNVYKLFGDNSRDFAERIFNKLQGKDEKKIEGSPPKAGVPNTKAPSKAAPAA